MNRKKIAIIGGGLSGLYAAYLLEKQGITDYILLEARARLGGRIQGFSVGAKPHTDYFDLGPSWFWPDFQTQLDALIATLGLERFAQFEQGNIVVERSANESPVTMQGYINSPTSMRIKGGTGSLIRALSAELNNKDIYLSANVQSIDNNNSTISVNYQHQRTEHNVVVEHVFLALPPRLAIEQINFTPKLPDELASQWKNTATWMASHAKYIAIYDKPFWQEKGLSGSARSAQGPMVEIHDASMPDGKAALFGFLGVPANIRENIDDEDLKTHCRAQFARLFGKAAGKPESDFIKDWAQDPLTATAQDIHASAEHPKTPDSEAHTGEWQNNLTGIGSEWSVQFPGYIAGAVEAANNGVEQYLATHA